MPDANPPVLALEHVSRRLAGRTVVRGVDISVARGEVLGLLGVNGAGKSTTLRMMAGVLAPSVGCVRLNGLDLQQHPAAARRGIGYLPEIPPLHAELTALEFLDFCARLHGLSGARVTAAVDRSLERCELGEVRHRPMATLSKGFRQRVGVAQAILHEPELIVLDEPASGLDPVQALKLRELVRGLGREHAVVLSTHVLPDVSTCCDRVAILHAGELRHVGPAGNDLANNAWRVEVVQLLRAEDWLDLPMVTAAEPIDRATWRLRLEPDTAADTLSAAIVERGFGLRGLRADQAQLEQTFLDIAASEAVA